MTEIGYHRVLDSLKEAASRTRCGMLCLAVPLSEPGKPVWDSLRGAARLAHKRFVFREHVAAIRRLAESPPPGPILFREFSTLPMAWLAPRLRPFRDRVFLLINHNLQWAMNSTAQRLGLRRLERAGFRFVFFETVPAEPLRSLGLNPDLHRSLPLPVAACPPPRATRLHTPPRIGIVGQYRREKGMDAAIFELLNQHTIPLRLRIGVPNPDVFRHAPAFARRAEFELLDTGADADYHRFLSECDLLVLNYEASSYTWRPSGLIADAAAAGTPVITPDFPVQRIQSQTPGPIGELRRVGEPIETVLARALDGLRAGRYDFEQYARARSPDALARLLDSWTM